MWSCHFVRKDLNLNDVDFKLYLFPKKMSLKKREISVYAEFSAFAIMLSRRCGPLCGPLSSSCGGLRPLAKAVLCPLGNKETFLY